MGFKTVISLEADTATAIGGVDKRTGKANPKQVEGYFLGSRKVESRKSKSGFAYLHVLQTANGNLGVWGKTDMDRKLLSVPAGTMVRITHTGMQPTPNGDMYKYRVEQDDSNQLDVSGLSSEAPQEAAEEETSEPVAGFSDEPQEEDSEEQESSPARYSAPVAQAKAPSAAQQERARAILNAARKR